MAIEYKDRIKDQTSTTGTGTFTIDLSPPSGFRSFAAHSTGATVRYSVSNATGTEWETGAGVWTSGASTLTRAQVFSSSAGGTTLCNFTSGAKSIVTGPVAADFIDAATKAGDEVLTNKTLTNPAWSQSALTDAATINWDAANGSMALVTLTGNRVLANPTNMRPGPYYLFVTQDGVGSRTLTYGSAYQHASTPNLSTEAGKTDCFYYVCDGTKLYGGIHLRGMTIAAAPAPSPAPAPAPAVVGDRVFACYFTGWDSTYEITDVPLIFNHIYLFHMVPDGPTPNTNNNGTGAFKFDYGYTVSQAQIQVCRARGQKVIMTIGGANNGFNFNTRAESELFVASFISTSTTYGPFDGCDFNNYEAGVGSTSTEMIWIAQQLRLEYGNNFLITSPPEPDYAPDRAMLQAMNNGGALSWAGPQFYDWSGFKAAGFVKGRIDEWVTLLGSESKVLVGFSAGYNYANALTLAECIREWDNILAAHPSIGGMYCWSAQHNLADANTWGTAMYARLGTAPAPAPAGTVAVPDTITVGSYPALLLQIGNDSDAYFVEDNRWGAGTITEGTAVSQYEQKVGRSPTILSDGAVAARMQWRWPNPLGSSEVKCFPAILSGRKPGYASTGTWVDGKPIQLLNGTQSTRAPSGDTPGTFLPIQCPVTSLKTKFAVQEMLTPTGRGQLVYDIWLQSAAAQTAGWASSSITHEIMVPVRNWGNYGGHGGTNGRNGFWYDHDVTLGGVLYHVYATKTYDPTGPNHNALLYNFGYLNGTYGRSGWKMIAFVPDVMPVPNHTIIDLAAIINHCSTRADIKGNAWATGTEYVSSIELGVEVNEGPGDLVLYNYKAGITVT